MLNKKRRKIVKLVNDTFAKKVVDLIKESNNIVITSHKGPDEDSIMSTLAMYYYIINYLKIDSSKVKMIYSWRKLKTWDYFDNYDKIEFVDDIANYLEGVDLLILLDGSEWRRFTGSEDIDKFPCKTICIDHHPDPDEVFDHLLVADNYSANCEILYDLFYKDKKLNKYICEVLLTGILSDTGNFRFVKPNHTEVYLVAKKLVEEGNIWVEELQSKYIGMSKKAYKILSEFMINSKEMEVSGWPEFLVAYIGRDTAKNLNCNDDEIAEAASYFSFNFAKNIEGITWGLVLYPRQDGTSHLSGRSIPESVSIRDIFEKMKIGGGHDRAAGGTIDVPEPKDALETLVKWLKHNKPKITK